MKFRIILIIIIPLLILNCALFPEKSDSFFTESDFTIVENTLEILDYGYGYDREMEIHYIFSYSYSAMNEKKKEKMFVEALKGIDISNLLSVYYKLLKMQASAEYKMSRYKEKLEWRYYTFIKKELYNPLEKYIVLLRKNILKKAPDLKQDLIEKKLALQAEVIESYIKDEEVIDTF